MVGVTDEPISRSEFEHLKARVRKLEHLAEANGWSETSGNGELDSRDATLIQSLEHGRGYTPGQITKLYQNTTDIRRKKTAKERTKALLQRDFFKRDGRRHIYRGVEK